MNGKEYFAKYRSGTKRSGWGHYEEFVLTSLDRLEKNTERTHVTIEEHIKDETTEFQKVRETLVELKTRIAIWGAILFGVATLLSPFLAEAVQTWLKR